MFKLIDIYKSSLRLIVILIGLFLVLGLINSTTSSALANNILIQQPTVDVPTVTSTSSGPTAVVNPDSDQINVRSGPSRDYPVVGVLVAGQRVPAQGRSGGGDWLQIAYPGVEGGVAWVYAYLVTVDGSVPIVEPPPTPTPRVTPTIDPTLAAQFVIEIPPTRLPTFTPPPPLVIPTFTQPPAGQGTGGVPMGFVITGMGVLGLFGILISLLRGR
jgi:SH3-like domain-containing protein